MVKVQRKESLIFRQGKNTMDKAGLELRMSGKILLKHDYEGNLLNAKQMY